MRDRLRALTAFTEIISWKLRFFVPTADAGAILGRLLEAYPICRITERAVAS